MIIGQPAEPDPNNGSASGITDIIERARKAQEVALGQQAQEAVKTPYQLNLPINREDKTSPAKG